VDKSITVLGNSHVWFFTGRDEVSGMRLADHQPIPTDNEFRVIPIGPATAWNFPNKHLYTCLQALNKNNIKTGSRVILVFGEVDCRVHIPKRAERDVAKTWIEAVKAADRYINGVRELCKDYKVTVWGVTPPGGEGEDPDYPRYGELFHRRLATEMFNARVADGCASTGVGFQSLYWHIHPSDQHEYYLDEIHLNQKGMPKARELLGL